MGRINRGRRSLLILLQTLSTVLLVEIGMRVAFGHTFPLSSLSDGVPPSVGRCTALYPERRGVDVWGDTLPPAPDLTLVKDSVVFLGASSMGGGYPIVPDKLASGILKEVYGIPTENFAFPGDISENLLGCTKAIAPYKPRAVVIYFGHNDETQALASLEKNPASLKFVEPVLLPGRTPWGGNKLESALVKNSYLLYWIYMRSPSLTCRFDWQWRMPDSACKSFYAQTTYKSRAVFSEILDTISAEGVPVILMTVISNLQSPCGGKVFFQESDSMISACAIEERAEVALEQGNRVSGLALLKEAKSFSKRAGRLAPYLYEGASPYVNEMIRGLATERNLTLIDTEAFFDRHFIEGDVEYGCDMFGVTPDFCDSIHPNEKVHRLFAELIHSALENLSISKAASEAN